MIEKTSLILRCYGRQNQNHDQKLNELCRQLEERFGTCRIVQTKVIYAAVGLFELPGIDTTGYLIAENDGEKFYLIRQYEVELDCLAHELLDSSPLGVVSISLLCSQLQDGNEL